MILLKHTDNGNFQALQDEKIIGIFWCGVDNKWQFYPEEDIDSTSNLNEIDRILRTLQLP